MNRRNLLGGSAALLAVPAAAIAATTTTHLDAALIAACAAYDACEIEYTDIWDVHMVEEDTALVMSRPLWDRQAKLLDQIAALHATTTDGIMARVRTLAIHNDDGAYSMDIDPEAPCGRMMIALIRDALEISARPVPARLLRGGLS